MSPQEYRELRGGDFVRYVGERTASLEPGETFPVLSGIKDVAQQDPIAVIIYGQYVRVLAFDSERAIPEYAAEDFEVVRGEVV